MENLNAEQVKKALECCAAAHSSYCRQCPVDVKKQEDCECGTFLAGQALALINSQEQRIKELTEENERLRVDKQHSAEQKEYILSTIMVAPIEETVYKVIELIKNKGYAYGKSDLSMGKETILGYQISVKKLDQIAKEVLEGVE